MKIRISITLFFVCALFSAFAQNTTTKGKSFSITLKNPHSFPMENRTVAISCDELLKKHPDFDFEKFSAAENGKTIPAEAIKNFTPGYDALLINLSFKPSETKTIVFTETGTASPLPEKKTQAYLGQKTDYKRVDKYYKEGKFISVTYTKAPPDHFAHDALYQFEGPGWESDKIGYRFYLDDRNRTDIFGKITEKLTLNITGINDLDSGNEGYQNPQDWGMDIFKVNNSLGIGSIATMDSGKVITVSVTDSVICRVENNNSLFSKINTQYYGWLAAGKKYDLSADISILGGSRLTKNDLTVKGNIPNICTGIAKHDSTNYIMSKPESSAKWGYIALFGNQSRDGGKLGIAVFYKKADLIKNGESSDSYLVLLKPENGKVTYYFAAAWDKEPGGIKTEEEFIKYLEETTEALSQEIEVVL
jgi:hypothetical protein